MKEYLQELKVGGRPMTKNELKIKELEQRIDKAIEYIKSYLPNYDFDHSNLEKLLEILGDRENVNK
jgi:Zn-dependent M16 (insulinase) family peptidase